MMDVIETLQKEVDKRWPNRNNQKVRRYVGQFFNCQRLAGRVSAEVQGNHGVYKVSLRVDEGGGFSAACSCYIGKHGYCHHCAALGETFLQRPEAFTVTETKSRDEVHSLDDLAAYLNSTTLEELLQQLRSEGITQKAFGEVIGMSSRHLSSMKSSELRNRIHKELGATKLAVLWMLENYGKTG